MTITFRDPSAFWRESLAVTSGAALAGAAAGVATPALGIPPLAGAGAAAILGGCLGAAAVMARSATPGRWLLSVATALSGGGAFALLADALDLGPRGVWAGGAVGAALLAMLLQAAEGQEGRAGRAGRADQGRLARIAGVICAAVAGAWGGEALGRIAAFAAAESAPVAMTSAVMAGAFGLWTAAAAGLRRLERSKDPLALRADALLTVLAEPVHARVRECVGTWREVGVALEADASMLSDRADEARQQARRLLESILETAQTWRQLQCELRDPRAAGLAARRADLEHKASVTTDAATAAHLLRASQALQAQQSALEGLRVGAERAEAAMDAQAALLERLRLAVAQHRVSDRERFAVELSAVSEQVARLADDLDSLSTAIAESESLADRRMLADLERAGRRALTQLDANRAWVSATQSAASGASDGEAGTATQTHDEREHGRAPVAQRR